MKKKSSKKWYGFFMSTEFKLFLTFFIIYSCFAHFINWNENSRMDLTIAIVDEHRFEIDTHFNNTGDRAVYDGHYYSDKEPGMSFFAVPYYMAYKKVFEKPEVHNNLKKYGLSRSYLILMLFAIIGTSAIAGALSIVLVYKALLHFTSNRRHIIIITLTFGLGTLVMIYSRLFMNHAVAMFFSFFSFYLLLLTKKTKEDYSFIAGFFGGVAILTQLSTMVIVLGNLIYLFSFKRKKIIMFVIGCLIGLIPFFLYNYSIFGNPFELTYFHMDRAIWDFESFNGQFNFRTWDGLNIMFRLLFFPYKGLFFYSPILIFSFLGMKEMYKKFKTETLLILSFFIIILLYNSQLNIWYGGSSFGPRHFVILMPFLMLPLAYSFKRLNKKMLITFVIISIIFNFSGVQSIEDRAFPHEGFGQSKNDYIIPVANPIFDQFLPKLITLGPDSRLLFDAFGLKHRPFQNVGILLVIISLIWAVDIFKMIKQEYKNKI